MSLPPNPRGHSPARRLALLAALLLCGPAALRAAEAPRINGPSIYGVRPGAIFIYHIPATGDRPLTFSARGLPPGLALDANLGIITGKVADKGETTVTLGASNAAGTSEKKFRIVAGDDIALTPPMGWNSWNCWHSGVTQARVLAAAQAMHDSGLDQHGWTYVNIDDGWQGARGGPLKAIQPNSKFPDMKGLCDQVHALGLKVGIYSTPWVTSYGGFVGGSSPNEDGKWDGKDPAYRKGPYNKNVLPFALGKYPFAKQDSQQWAEWNIDYLKYDWGPVDVASATEMENDLRATGRDIVLSLSNNGAGNVFSIIAELSKHAQSWRTTNDINDSWNTVKGIGFSQDKWAPYARPGHWNDPDMFEVGANGGGTPKKLTHDEQTTHVSLWCLLSAPLLLGCDLQKLDPFTLGLLTNDEVLDIDQDALGKQAVRVSPAGTAVVYAKPMEDGSWAVGLFNLGDAPADVSVTWAELKMDGSQTVRDLWLKKDLGTFQGQYTAPAVPSHGVVLLRIRKA